MLTQGGLLAFVGSEEAELIHFGSKTVGAFKRKGAIWTKEPAIKNVPHTLDVAVSGDLAAILTWPPDSVEPVVITYVRGLEGWEPSGKLTVNDELGPLSHSYSGPRLALNEEYLVVAAPRGAFLFARADDGKWHPSEPLILPAEIEESDNYQCYLHGATVLLGTEDSKSAEAYWSIFELTRTDP